MTKVEQLKQILLEDIRKGVYAPGDPLPSVMKLVDRYQISKATVSQTLSVLDELGVIRVSHGKTTRVRARTAGKKLHILYVGAGDSLQNAFWGDVTRGIFDALSASSQYELDQTLGSAGWQKKTICRFFNPSNSCGIFVLGTSDRTFLESLRETGVPLLSVGTFHGELPLPYVAADFTPALDDLCERLRVRGCRRAALLHAQNFHDAPGGVRSGLNYEKTFRTEAMLLRAGLMPDLSYSFACNAIADARAGYQFLHTLRKRGMSPDALILARDAAAPGVYRAGYELGIHFPDDCPVIGFDNLEEDEFLVPSLSSVTPHRYQLGACAGGLMLDFLERGIPLETRRIPAELIRRESLQ